MDMENAIENKLEELMSVINEIRNDAHALHASVRSEEHTSELQSR